MTDRLTPAECNYTLLRNQLTDALIEAEKCDPIVAIHIETALAVLDERCGPH
jgi:hypothetical protein